MKAIVQHRYGQSTVLRMAELPVPAIEPDEVLVEVHAASMHADVWHAVSGVVVEVGSAVTGFARGDEVFGETTRRQQWTNGGAFAEFTAVPAAALARKPERLTHVEAAAVPTSGLIAVQVVEDEGRVKAGDAVLVNGAGGGVGVFAVQVAMAAGGVVTAVDHTGKLDALRRLGVDEVVDYTTTDVTARTGAYDVFIDVAGTRPPRRARQAVSTHGAYVLVGHDHYGADRREWVGSIATFAGMMLVSPLVPQYHVRFPRSRESRMHRLVDLIEAGQLSPVVDRTFPLDQVPQALDHLISGTGVGKIVIAIASP
jgi:NADPH:quinone reductase-like Zn-dependent oxidoreductase